MIKTWYEGKETLSLLKNENRKILSIEHIGGMGAISLFVGVCLAIIFQMITDADLNIGMGISMTDYALLIAWRTFACAGGIFLLLMIIAVIKKIRFTLSIKKFEKQLKNFEPKRLVPDPKCKQKYEWKKM